MVSNPHQVACKHNFLRLHYQVIPENEARERIGFLKSEKMQRTVRLRRVGDGLDERG